MHLLNIATRPDVCNGYKNRHLGTSHTPANTKSHNIRKRGGGHHRPSEVEGNSKGNGRLWSRNYGREVNLLSFSESRHRAKVKLVDSWNKVATVQVETTQPWLYVSPAGINTVQLFLLKNADIPSAAPHGGRCWSKVLVAHSLSVHCRCLRAFQGHWCICQTTTDKGSTNMQRIKRTSQWSCKTQSALICKLVKLQGV